MPDGPFRAVENHDDSAGELRELKLLNEIGTLIATDLKLDAIVQKVTDVGTELCGAQFGAFFYNVINDEGEAYLLYALSGLPRSAFESFGMPRNTAIFDTTFRGLGVLRSDDITADPRYGKQSPHFGMPKGHPPVVSYLAVPVTSRDGKIIGGLFFGHPEKGRFSEADEKIIQGVAARAAVAIDNARLLEAAQRLAMIVESSDDAIVSKDLNGIIKTWNRGAERIFGWTAKEIVGKSILTVIPDEYQHEESIILGKITRGERMDHYETVRQHKDGSRIHVSITVSPIRDASGTITGASKVARDITESKRAQERQKLLLREMSHRVKNLFALTSGVVSLSARSATTPKELAHLVQSRIAALARAHDLTLPGGDGETPRQAALSELVKTILSPYDDDGRISMEGPPVECGPTVSTSFALLLHEFATNSVKYGALSLPTGHINVTWAKDGLLALVWRETGGPPVERTRHEGFGGVLVDATIKSLGGIITRDWAKDGLIIRLTVPLERVLA